MTHDPTAAEQFGRHFLTETETTTMTTYTTIGDIRGACGHQHRTLEAAEKCRAADAAGCKSQGGYSDRRVRYGDLSPLDGHDADRLLDIQCDAVDAR